VKVSKKAHTPEEIGPATSIVTLQALSEFIVANVGGVLIIKRNKPPGIGVQEPVATVPELIAGVPQLVFEYNE